MISNLCPVVVLVLFILLVGEVVAPRGQRKSESPPMRRRESQTLGSESLGSESEFYWAPDEPHITYDQWADARKQKAWEKGKQPWEPPQKQLKSAPQFERKPSPEPSPKSVMSFQRPVNMSPAESKQPARKGLPDVLLRCQFLQITERMRPDECLENGPTRSATRNCQELVSNLNALPEEFRTQRCRKITEGECRETGVNEVGKKIYRCTRYPYRNEGRALKRCFSRKVVDRSDMIIFQFCPRTGIN